MGFSRAAGRSALAQCKGNVQSAIDLLLSSGGSANGGGGGGGAQLEVEEWGKVWRGSGSGKQQQRGGEVEVVEAEAEEARAASAAAAMQPVFIASQLLHAVLASTEAAKYILAPAADPRKGALIRADQHTRPPLAWRAGAGCGRIGGGFEHRCWIWRTF